MPALLAEEQWEALGRRLRGIESSLQVHAAPQMHAQKAPLAFCNSMKGEYDQYLLLASHV